jgi:hypothetical protein
MLFDIAYALQLVRLIDFERLAFDAAYRRQVLGTIVRPDSKRESHAA